MNNKLKLSLAIGVPVLAAAVALILIVPNLRAPEETPGPSESPVQSGQPEATVTPALSPEPPPPRTDAPYITNVLYNLNARTNNLISNLAFNSAPPGGWGAFADGSGLSFAEGDYIGVGGGKICLRYDSGPAAGKVYALKLPRLEPNIKYTFSFWYNVSCESGTPIRAGLALDGDGTILDREKGLGFSSVVTLNTVPGWKQTGFSFKSTVAEELYLYIESTGEAGIVLMDRFQLFDAEDGYDDSSDAPILITPYNEWMPIGSMMEGLYVKGGLNGANNLIGNGNFEEPPEGSWNTPAFLNSVCSLTEEEAYDGVKCLKFSAKGLSNTEQFASSVFWVTVEGNKTYIFGAMVKAYGLNENNSGDLQFGIISAGNMKFILPDYPIDAIHYVNKNVRNNYTYDQQMNPSGWDGYWKQRAMQFTVTGGEPQTIGIYITARNSTVYFDNMFLAEVGDVGRDEPSRFVEVKNVVQDPDNPVCADEHNLVTDFDFGKGSADWTSIHGYGNFVAITPGAGLSFTGKGTNAYYFRWFDVEPETDYTFSVYAKGEKEGDMIFGLVDSNAVVPKYIGGKEGAVTPEWDGKWRLYSVSFNSDAYTKIGFFICDGTGRAQFNKVRLFESVNGKPFTESDTPN